MKTQKCGNLTFDYYYYFTVIFYDFNIILFFIDVNYIYDLSKQNINVY